MILFTCLIATLSLFVIANSQSCTQPLPLPAGADLNNDDSGLRPSKQPPIPIGGTLTYQCPGVKSSYGKSTWVVSCNELGSYVFPSDLNVWPICQCNEDLSMKCVGVTYKMRYIEGNGDVGKMTLVLPQPPKLKKWTMSITTDLNAQALNPMSINSFVTMTGQTSFTIQPLTSADMNAAFTSVDVTYNFTGAATQGFVPRWKFPCVASIECDYEVENSTTTNEIWMIVGLAAAGFVLLIILFSFCVCCCCKGATKPERSVSSATSQTSDWTRMEENHFRQLNNRPPGAAVNAPSTWR